MTPRAKPKKWWFTPTSNITLCGLQSVLFESRLAQFMCINNTKIFSAAGGPSRGQTRKPNSILEAGVLKWGIIFCSKNCSYNLTKGHLVHRHNRRTCHSLSNTINWPVMRRLTQTPADWPTVMVYNFHLVCSWPEATDLFWNGLSFVWEVDKICCLQGKWEFLWGQVPGSHPSFSLCVM